MPYDLTYKWNLINKTNKQATQNQRLEIKNKQTVTRGEVGGDTGGKKGEGFSRTSIKDTWTKPKGVGQMVGSGDGWGGGSCGGKWRQLYLNHNEKTNSICLLLSDLFHLA